MLTIRCNWFRLLCTNNPQTITWSILTQILMPAEVNELTSHLGSVPVQVKVRSRHCIAFPGHHQHHDPIVLEGKCLSSPHYTIWTAQCWDRKWRGLHSILWPKYNAEHNWRFTHEIDVLCWQSNEILIETSWEFWKLEDVRVKQSFWNFTCPSAVVLLRHV